MTPATIKRAEFWQPMSFDQAVKFVVGMDGDIARFGASTEAHMAIIRKYWDGEGIALDYGCGIGRLTRKLAETAKYVVGADISESMLHFAKEVATAPHIRWHLIDRLPLPFDDGHFDFGLCFRVLDHLDKADAREVVKEIRRLCKSYLLAISAFGRAGDVLPNPIRSGIPPTNLAWTRAEIPDAWGQVELWDDGGYPRWLVHLP